MINWFFFGLRGKQGKYYFSRRKAPKLFQLVWTSLLVAVPVLEARELLKFLEDPTFADLLGRIRCKGSVIEITLFAPH